ncbi:MAG: cytochrome C554 [Bacteroidetes bacterium]|nr:cytochrome C554 [Bacteroidota bacterium]
MSKRNLLLMLSLVLFMGSTVIAQNKYVGADKCKMCHNSPAKGEQYKLWQGSKHSQAMKSLSSPEALDYAKKNGIADPATDPKCTKCHSTAAGADKALVEATLTVAEGVSCESCHGPGSVYKGMAIMKVQADAVKNGLIIPDEKTCTVCHTKEGNPFYKEFNYSEFSKKIAHPNPTKAK